MDKGIKILQNHVKKIEKANNHILEKTLAHALKLKSTRLSDISYKKTATFEILINKDTNNFPSVKQKLLAKISELHIQYPFITIYFDPNPEVQPNPRYVVSGPNPAKMNTNVNVPINQYRELKSQNENRLILTINWEDYMRHSLKGKEEDGFTLNLPRLGVEEHLNEIKRKNWSTIQEAINKILSSASQHSLDDKTETRVLLQNNTMAHEITRNHFSTISQQIMRHYNGMIEIFNTSASTIAIRVHWNVYLSKMAALEHQQRQVPLLTDSSLDYLHRPVASVASVASGASGAMNPLNSKSPYGLPTYSYPASSAASASTSGPFPGYEFNKTSALSPVMGPMGHMAHMSQIGLVPMVAQQRIEEESSSEPEYVKEYQRRSKHSGVGKSGRRKRRVRHSHSDRTLDSRGSRDSRSEHSAPLLSRTNSEPHKTFGTSDTSGTSLRRRASSSKSGIVKKVTIKDPKESEKDAKDHDNRKIVKKSIKTVKKSENDRRTARDAKEETESETQTQVESETESETESEKEETEDSEIIEGEPLVTLPTSTTPTPTTPMPTPVPVMQVSPLYPTLQPTMPGETARLNELRMAVGIETISHVPSVASVPATAQVPSGPYPGPGSTPSANPNSDITYPILAAPPPPQELPSYYPSSSISLLSSAPAAPQYLPGYSYDSRSMSYST